MAERISFNNKDNKRPEARLTPITEHSDAEEESDLEPIPDVQVSTCVQMPLDLCSDILDMLEDQKFIQLAKDSDNQMVPAKGETLGVFGNAIQPLVPGDVSDPVPGNLPDAVTAAVPDTVSGDVPDAVSEAVPDAVSDDVPDTVSDAVPDALSGAVPDAVPDAVSDAVSDAVPDAMSDTVPDAVYDEKFRNEKVQDESTCRENEGQCDKHSLSNDCWLQDYLNNYFAMIGKRFSRSEVIRRSDLHAATLLLGIKWETVDGILMPVKTKEHHLNKQEAVPKIHDNDFASQSSCLSVKANIDTGKKNRSSYSQADFGSLFSDSTNSRKQVTSIPARSENRLGEKMNTAKEQQPTICHATRTYSFSLDNQSSQHGNSSDAEKLNLAQLNTESLQTGQSTDQLPTTSNRAPVYTKRTESATNFTTSHYSANKLIGKHTSADILEREEKKRRRTYERSRKTPAMSDLSSDHPT